MSTGRAGAGHESAGNRGPIGAVTGDAVTGDAVTRGASAKGMVLNLSCMMTAACHPPRLPLRQPGSDTTLRKLWHIPDAT